MIKCETGEGFFLFSHNQISNLLSRNAVTIGGKMRALACVRRSSPVAYAVVSACDPLRSVRKKKSCPKRTSLFVPNTNNDVAH